MRPQIPSLRKRRGQRGQIITETALLFFFLGAMTLVIITALGPALNDVYNDIIDALTGNWFDMVPVIEETGAGPCVTWVLGDQRGGSYCDQNEYCELIDNAGNDGEWTSASTVYVIVVKGGQQYRVYYKEGQTIYTTDDGCYQVIFDDARIEWHKIGGGRNCKDVSHVQSWLVEFCEDSVTQ
jgi:hypothetical protein